MLYAMYQASIYSNINHFIYGTLWYEGKVIIHGGLFSYFKNALDIQLAIYVSSQDTELHVMRFSCVYFTSKNFGCGIREHSRHALLFKRWSMMDADMKSTNLILFIWRVFV